MARAHCWAPYDDVAAALRTPAFQTLRESAGRDAAREVLRGLFQHPAPFDVNVQFPEGQVFLPVDHGVFGQCVFQILTELRARGRRRQRGDFCPSKDGRRLRGVHEGRGVCGRGVGEPLGAREAGAVRPGCVPGGVLPHLVELTTSLQRHTKAQSCRVHSGVLLLLLLLLLCVCGLLLSISASVVCFCCWFSLFMDQRTCALICP